MVFLSFLSPLNFQVSAVTAHDLRCGNLLLFYRTCFIYFAKVTSFDIVTFSKVRLWCYSSFHCHPRCGNLLHSLTCFIFILQNVSLDIIAFSKVHLWWGIPYTVWYVGLCLFFVLCWSEKRYLNLKSLLLLYSFPMPIFIGTPCNFNSIWWHARLTTLQ